MERFGRSAVLVDGRLDERAKTAAFVRFNHRPDCRLLVGNLQAAGVAWSCTATSHAAVCEFPWRPDELAQFVARMHGIGRGQVGVPVQVWYLVAPDTIEADLCQVLQVKQSHADQALDGAPRGVTLDIYDQVKALMKARRRRRELER
jgi:SNF2 family DNA or RNA helicase